MTAENSALGAVAPSSARFGEELARLPEIFEGRYFVVPDYQRGYSWEEKQVGELLNDIDHLMRDGVDLSHYTGTLVLSCPDATVKNLYHIVDGQQRLTTLVILLSVLHDNLPKHERTAFKERYLWRGAPGNRTSVLRLNSDCKAFFERRVIPDKKVVQQNSELDAHQRLAKARELIEQWVSERMKVDKIPATSLCHTIERELGFLVYAPRENAETGIMFEVINNRGKRLSELEKVKNYLIYCCVKLSAASLRETIDDCWSEILRCLNVARKTTAADEGAFLRYCVAVHFKLGKTDSQYGYDQLKKIVNIDAAIGNPGNTENTISGIEEFVAFLKDAAQWYGRLFGQQHEGLSKELTDVLDLIRAQERQASILPLFLALVIKNRGKGGRLVSLLQLVEKLNFRVYMARRMTARNDSGQADLFEFAQCYYHDQLRKHFGDFPGAIQDEDSALEYCLVEFIHDNASDRAFLDSFSLPPDSPDDFFNWPGLRYFLMNYEAELQPNKTIPIDKITLSRSEGKSADYLSVEHIWAREFRNGKGENDRKSDYFERRRLGNFVLLELRLNVIGGKKCINEKVRIYTRAKRNEPASDLHQVTLMAQDAKAALRKHDDRSRTKNYYLDLFRELIGRQEMRYLKFAQKRWSVQEYPSYELLLQEQAATDEAE